jgi:hypothetical protein
LLAAETTPNTGHTNHAHDTADSDENTPERYGDSADDFTVDEQAGTVPRPNDNTRPISTTRVATFGKLCRTGPLRARCTKSKTGRRIVLHERDAVLRQARSDWANNPNLRHRTRLT